MKSIKAKILYAEDDRIDQMVFAQFVKSHGLQYDYKLAGSVREAKEILSAESFDVLITDYSLGDGNGFDLFSCVKNNTPIIFVTSVSDLNLAVKAVKEGAYDYLVKDLSRHYLELLPLTVKKALDHKRANEELIKAKQQVQESLEAKEHFLANISHEIRTPMNAIMGFADLINRTPLSPEQKKYLSAIRTSGENLVVIINDILDFSKIKSGKFSFEQTPFRLSEVLSMATEILLHRSVEKGIRLSKSLPPDLPDHLIGDPTRLNQILTNLLGNAIKFTARGEVKLAVNKLQEDAQRVELKFSVVDTGIGIPQEKLSSIFDEFVQAANDTTRKYGGSGLGLAIVKQLVEMQGGKISVESTLGQGSLFSFTLSYPKASGEQVGASSKPANTQQSSGTLSPGLRVLVVEDNQLNQLLIEKYLADSGCLVQFAEDGLIAIQKMEKNDFDIILIDIQLPEMDGYQTTAHIRKKMSPPKSETPIIAMTAHAVHGEEAKCLAVGMNGYISKPFKWEALKSKMVQLLDSKKSVL